MEKSNNAFETDLHIKCSSRRLVKEDVMIEQISPNLRVNQNPNLPRSKEKFYCIRFQYEDLNNDADNNDGSHGLAITTIYTL